MLTIAHADRGRPTLKDDERFRNGLVCEYKHEYNVIWKCFGPVERIVWSRKIQRANQT